MQKLINALATGFFISYLPARVILFKKKVRKSTNAASKNGQVCGKKSIAVK